MITDISKMWDRCHVPSVKRQLFLMNVCAAFDSKISLAWSFCESPHNKVLISL